MGRPIDMEWKGCELIIHDHGIDFCVTMVQWVDVSNIDRGDIRRRRAVNTSTLFYGLNDIDFSISYWIYMPSKHVIMFQNQGGIGL